MFKIVYGAIVPGQLTHTLPITYYSMFVTALASDTFIEISKLECFICACLGFAAFGAPELDINVTIANSIGTGWRRQNGLRVRNKSQCLQDALVRSYSGVPSHPPFEGELVCGELEPITFETLKFSAAYLVAERDEIVYYSLLDVLIHPNLERNHRELAFYAKGLKSFK